MTGEYNRRLTLKRKEGLTGPLSRYNLCGVRTTCSLVVFSGSVVGMAEAVAEYYKQSEHDKSCRPDHIIYKQTRIFEQESEAKQDEYKP
jgi:hypothetical protein